jgi:methylated-DNA-[protein]-cysteine S-methyltransferase
VTSYCYTESPVGKLLLVAEDGVLIGLHFVGGRHPVHPERGWTHDERASPLPSARRQLREYFTGERADFDLPIRLDGTEFQRRVWEVIARIPPGKTITYAQLAEASGAPGSSRAAGAATGRNPIAIIVPCHRVVGSSGSLTGYGGGLDRKRLLLQLEGVSVPPEEQSLFARSE